MAIDEDRIKHILAVAEKMKRMVEEDPGNYRITPQDAFLIGYLHDIGYEFTDIQTEHEHLGGNILKKVDYKYWREIYHHGDPSTTYDSEELRLLNTADLTTDKYGNDVTVEDRLKDIENRYGSDSVQYLNAYDLAKRLGLA